MSDHEDALASLNDKRPLKEKLGNIHTVIKQFFPHIARIAIAVYEPKTTVLKTFLHSSGEDDPLSHYTALLDEAPSLKSLLEKGEPRVINNMVTMENGSHEHTKRIGRQGYAASYTMPMFHNGIFFGFVFFNSYEKNVFDENTLRQLDVYGHMIALMTINELSAIRTLTAAVKTTGDISHLRDPETGSHMDRMSRYSRLIAMELANDFDLNDDYIEHVFMFSPLHDIGKVGIPDSILLKNGPLDSGETRIMQTHAEKGRQMIDELTENFGLDSLDFVEMLKNIATYHHEAVNGTGYPYGIGGEEIPLEARIVAVADVFDALTSERPYKKAWSNDDAFAMLEKLSGEKLDHRCVQALIKNRDVVESIQKQFKEDTIG